MPRPKVLPELKRSCYVLVTLTPREREHLEEIKEQGGKTCSAILRNSFLIAFPITAENKTA